VVITIGGIEPMHRIHAQAADSHLVDRKHQAGTATARLLSPNVNSL
jgi:hypothetical protein